MIEKCRYYFSGRIKADVIDYEFDPAGNHYRVYQYLGLGIDQCPNNNAFVFGGGHKGFSVGPELS